MQSDIVEELNESARRLIWLFNLENESGSIQTIREAATEITALRDRVARLEGERQWRPIETFFEQNEPHALHGSDPVYYENVLVYAATWDSAWDSPYDARGGRWGDDYKAYTASTYVGAPCWIATSDAPSDYDTYLKPTHWMPLPDSPPATDRV